MNGNFALNLNKLSNSNSEAMKSGQYKVKGCQQQVRILAFIGILSNNGKKSQLGQMNMKMTKFKRKRRLGYDSRTLMKM